MHAVTLHIVKLGSPRGPGEGIRLGTVRRPPRGVPKSEFASRDYYDVWLPTLAPSAELMKSALEAKHAGDEKAWARFERAFRAELRDSADASHLLDLLAALSHGTNVAIGCYCDDEAHCHRSILRELLVARGASIAE